MTRDVERVKLKEGERWKGWRENSDEEKKGKMRDDVFYVWIEKEIEDEVDDGESLPSASIHHPSFKKKKNFFVKLTESYWRGVVSTEQCDVIELYIYTPAHPLLRRLHCGIPRHVTLYVAASSCPHLYCRPIAPLALIPPPRATGLCCQTWQSILEGYKKSMFVLLGIIHFLSSDIL